MGKDKFIVILINKIICTGSSFFPIKIKGGIYMPEKDVMLIRKEIEKIKKSLEEVEKRLCNIEKIKTADQIYEGPVSEAP